jgi:hypothetical protein
MKLCLISSSFTRSNQRAMIAFLETIKQRNLPLFYFGSLCMLLSVLFFVLAQVSAVSVNGVSAWYKPFKFAVSIGIYSFTMALYCSYLPSFNTTLFNAAVIVLLGFEIAYIALQAGRGQLSHFNVSSPLYGALYAAMGIAATLVTLYTAYVAVLFMATDVVPLPTHYLWAVRAGLWIFVVFSFQGFLMGSRLSHTIGAPDGGEGIPVLNWSKTHGDARIAHFVGMHALQVLPLAAHFVLKSTVGVLVLAVAYSLLAVYTLAVALQGRPLW